MSVLAGLAAAALAMAQSAAPACPAPSAPASCADAGKCTGPLYEQAKREREQREAIEYARDLGQAVAERRDNAGLDRAYDLARLLMPNLLAPVDLAESGACTPIVEDGDGGTPIARATFMQALRRAAALPDDSMLAANDVTALAHQRTQCNDEARRTLARYLDTAIPAKKLREAWDFLVPRAGKLPPADPAQPLAGWRFTTFEGPGAPLGFYKVPAPDHIDGRRDRAQQFLANHPIGRAVMAAVGQFIASRTLDSRGEAALCPATFAATEKMIAALKR